MPLDLRFYDWHPGLTLGKLAPGASFSVSDPALQDQEVIGVGAASDASAGELAFFEGKLFDPSRLGSRDAFYLFHPKIAEAATEAGYHVLVADRPRLSFVRAARQLASPKPWPSGADWVHPDAVIEPGVVIGVGAVIGPDVHVGRGTQIGPGSVIGAGVKIGRDARIGAKVTIQCALIGDRVTILSGTCVGEAGFGTVAGADGAEDMPQLGRVIIQDDVTIGSNCCVDRGAFRDTVIGERTKIDNLSQIGHNVVIGRNVLMAAYAGLSGTVEVGDGAVFGGRVAVADHLTVGAGAKLAAGAAVMKDVPAGETWGGFPAKPFLRWMRETAWLQNQIKSKRKDD